MSTSLIQKLTASMVNCSIILILSVPFCDWWPNYWKAISVGLCFVYHMIFRRRCVGLMIARAYNSQPARATYVALYSCGYSTLLYWVLIPCDLLLCYGVAQALSVRLTGNTLPGWLTNSRTLNANAVEAPPLGNRMPVADNGTGSRFTQITV